MTNRDRFRAIFTFEKPDDRLPMIEWATWWGATLEAWRKQGLPADLEFLEIAPYLGLDQHVQFWLPHRARNCPKPAYHGGPLAEDEAGYEALRPYLFPDREIDGVLERMREIRDAHEAGDFPVWFSLDGGFWFPRTILGIENHLFSFYDQPELYHRILDDLAQWQIRTLERVYEVLTPDFMTFGEDMSYNNGPMISEACFDEFLLPYYRKLVPWIREKGTTVLVDSDGDVTKMIPWLQRAGIQGILPLERQAGVDVSRLRRDFPDFLLVGAFDKMTMRVSCEAMEGEFRRLEPVMCAGGFIPSVDHQTPPDVPLERYRRYLEMFRDYAERAVREA